MEREFIPYEQALDLKELGFDEPCFGCYTEKKEVIIRVGDYRSFLNNNSEDSIIRDFNSYENGTISAPLFSQAFRFFREKYRLIIQYIPYELENLDNYLELHHKFKISEYDGYRGGRRNTVETILTEDYEEAELACLNELIEIVKK